MKVRGMKWEDKTTPEGSQDNSVNATETSHDVELAPAADISETVSVKEVEQPAQSETEEMDHSTGDAASIAAPRDSEAETHEDIPSNKTDEPTAGSSADEPAPKSPSETTKRARDDSEHDDNPREKKRPSPPPDEKVKEPEASTSSRVESSEAQSSEAKAVRNSSTPHTC